MALRRLQCDQASGRGELIMPAPVSMALSVDPFFPRSSSLAAGMGEAGNKHGYVLSVTATASDRARDWLVSTN